MNLNSRLGIAVISLALIAGACSAKKDKDGAGKPSTQSTGGLTGEALFNERCLDCHTVNEKGGKVGPNLTAIAKVRSPAYLERMIREPSKVFPGSVMPPFDTLSKKQVDSLVDYLTGLK